jgi:hypothetical protein
MFSKKAKGTATKIIADKKIQMKLLAIFPKKVRQEAKYSNALLTFYEIFLGICEYLSDFDNSDPTTKYYYQKNEQAKAIANRVIKNLDQVTKDFGKLIEICNHDEFINVIERQWFYEQHPVGQYLNDKKKHYFEKHDLNGLRDFPLVWLKHVVKSDESDISIRSNLTKVVETSHMQTSLKASRDAVERTFTKNWNEGINQKGRLDDKPRTYDIFQRLATAFYTFSPTTTISYRVDSRFYQFANIVASEIGEQANLNEKIKAATWYTIELQKKGQNVLSPSMATESELEKISKLINLTPENYQNVLSIN